MSLVPSGDDLRKAVKWISEERLARPEAKPGQLAAAACARFDLSPKDADFLHRFVKENPSAAGFGEETD